MPFDRPSMRHPSIPAHPEPKSSRPGMRRDATGLIGRTDCVAHQVSSPKKRTGGNYFEALSLVGRLDAKQLNDPGNMLGLCANVAAQVMYAEFEWLDSDEEKILGFKAEKEGGTEAMRKISARVAGKTLTITWSERHFIRLCALWNAA
jgi:hypothetical protein